uniref:NADH-ubiquinone oxidoreductase chain 2 n=1 Tax=Paracatonidia sp. SX-2018 TaxID=2507540 RepID=A0A565D7D0_9HEMI|nr:NADH dehydrogenase subunit 2 [Paracatonidia sp. SX-2018]
MKLNSSKMMFLMMMITSTIMMMASNNMILSWMSMEINLISFMPLMTKSKKLNDQTMKYFIIQSLASSTMLMSILMNSTFEAPIEMSIMLMTSMLMKIGLMPFHMWMPNLMQSLEWNTCMLMMTWQKISPVIFTSQMINLYSLTIPMYMSLLLAPMVGMKQTAYSKILAYSSIANSPWMILSSKISKTNFYYFMMIYSMMNIVLMLTLKKNNMIFMNQMNPMSKFTKMMFMIMMLSISGMPPMMGFMPKWMILQSYIDKMLVMSMMMISSSMISTFIYIKMMYPMMMTSSTKKFINSIKEMKLMNFMLMNVMTLPMMLILKMF